MTRVKICGIKNIEDARAVFEAGADDLGFHVQLDGGRSPLSADDARKLITQLPPTASGVIVTSLTKPEELAELARQTGASTLQLYGEIDAEAMREVKHIMPVLKLWKVLEVEKEALAAAKKYIGAADALVLDTAKGGSGKTHDWTVSKKIREAVSIPVILAGGLNPENIAEAIATVEPLEVDVNSGVSNEDGTKNIEKVKAFIKAAKK